MKKFIDHIFKEHRIPAISVIILVFVFASIPNMQAREIKNAGAARIATLGAAFGKLAGRGGEEKYISSVSRDRKKIAQAVSSGGKKLAQFFQFDSGLAEKSLSPQLLSAGIKMGTKATGMENNQTALFDIQISPDPGSKNTQTGRLQVPTPTPSARYNIFIIFGAIFTVLAFIAVKISLKRKKAAENEK